MIPKRICYCWFGPNKIPRVDQENIDRWREICPDYEIVEINESNFDVNSNEYAKLAYEHENYAYVADVARLEYLKEHGGFYLDTDIELCRSLDIFRDNNALAFETGWGFYSNFVLGCDKFPEVYQVMLDSLKPGSEPAYMILHREIFKRYKPAGERKLKFKDITLYDVGFFPNIRTNDFWYTIGRNQERNSWVNSWTDGFNPKKTFIPVDISGGRYTEWAQDSFYEDMPIQGRMELPANLDLTIDQLEYCNYLLNENVIEIESPNGVKITRAGEIDKDHPIAQIVNGIGLQISKYV